MRTNKAPGIDGIEPEIMKALDPELQHQLYLIIAKAWKEGVPQEFKDAYIINLPKKVDKQEELQQCDNWRGISLLSIAGKVFTKIINQRLRKYVEDENIFPETQNGARAGRSTTDSIHCVKLAYEYRLEKKLPTYMTFYDLKKAYDKVPRKQLWKVLEKLGVPDRMRRVIQELHDGMMAMVDVEGELTEGIEVVNGVRQGCCLASLLFNIYSAVVTEYWREMAPGGVELCYTIDGKLLRHANQPVHKKLTIRDCHYVDDAVSISPSRREQIKITKAYQQAAKDWGQEMSIKKTKSMVVGGNGQNIQVEGGIVEDVKDFAYLGVVMQNSAGMEKELKNRLNKARASFAKLKKKVWNVKQLTLRTKIQVYKACILSVLFYGSETWTLTKPQVAQLEIFHMSCLRWITGINKRKQQSHGINNDKIRKIAKISTVAEIMHENTLRWLGHVARMSNESMCKKMLFAWEEKGDRGVGFKRGRYRDTVRRALKARKVDEALWLQRAQDRGQWRKIVKGTNEEVNPQQESKGKGKGGKKGQKQQKGGGANSLSADPPFDNAVMCPKAGCGKWCKGRKGLTKHVAFEHREGTEGQEGFKCSMCTYTTVNRCGVSKHERTCHNNPNNTPCPTCNLWFTDKYRYNKHVKDVHR